MTDSSSSPAPDAPAEPPLDGSGDPAHRPISPSSVSYFSSSPALSSLPDTPSLAYDSSVPGTPSLANPASLALDTPARELGNLSLAATPDGSTPGGTRGNVVSGVGADAHRITDHPGADAHHARLAEAVLARTSAGQQALKEGALPSAKGIPVPDPAASPAPSGGGEKASSTAATAGSSRTGTPAAPPASSVSGDRLAPPPASTHGRRPNLDGKVEGPAPKEGKKSVFGKLFDRGNASSASVASSAAMDRGGSSGAGVSGASASGASEPGAGAAINGLASGSSQGEAPLVARRPSAGPKRDKEEEKRIKEQEKRDKAERKEREKRDKEEAKERARSASRQRTPSQTGRPRAASKGAEEGGEKKGALDGAMDFMRIKVQRKSSVTSRKSDDGRSEKSVHLGDEGRSAYGGSQKEETRSRGAQSNASLSKKYGVCDKVIVGKGATAVVRLAHKWDRTQEKLYAVKEFRKRRKNETEKEYVKKLTSEFCISSTLHHHNVVETVDLVQDEQQHWCEVMEYCPGGDLYAVIKKGDLGPPEINSYFKQILAGVAYLHSMGVAHRDIKPENLLLDAKGHVKITDFGVSDVFRMCWEKTTHLSKGLCGSEPYIAPEQFEHKEYDARLVDVWATAVVYYCLTFQELPWRVAKASDPSFGPYCQAYRESSATPSPLNNIVPRECRSLIRRMLDPDPKARANVEVVRSNPWFQSIVVIPPLDDSLLFPSV
ncbi:hypothetical protein JCM10213_008472 [Rhodosporidiobolus nylandii]